MKPDSSRFTEHT